MSSKLKPFSFMGVSKPEMFLSEKDLSKSAVEFSFLVRHPLEFHEDQCKVAPFQDIHDDSKDKGERMPQQKDQQQQKQEEDKPKLMTLTVREFKVEHQEENDGFKTPTCLDHKIPAILKCPPAPRKPKTPKRKAFVGTRILLDLTKEIECLFPPALLADLGNKIKKVRQGSDFK